MSTKTTMIKLPVLTKEGLDEIKKKYSFSTYGEQLDSMVNFFLINKFNPRDLNFNNLESISYENRDYLKDISNLNTERIIKIIRNIELNSIDTIQRSTKNIETAVTEIFNKNHNEKTNETILENNNVSLNYESVIKKSDDEKSILIDEIEKLKTEKEEYHRCLETLNKSLKIVNNENDRKAFFNISVEEVERLFYLIP